MKPKKYSLEYAVDPTDSGSSSIEQDIQVTLQRLSDGMYMYVYV